MGQNKIILGNDQAESFARRIYMDIAAYIETHQEEYQEYLLQREQEELQNGSKTTYRQTAL